jgi:hypothetical protein
MELLLYLVDNGLHGKTKRFPDRRAGSTASS